MACPSTIDIAHRHGTVHRHRPSTRPVHRHGPSARLTEQRGSSIGTSHTATRHDPRAAARAPPIDTAGPSTRPIGTAYPTARLFHRHVPLRGTARPTRSSSAPMDAARPAFSSSQGGGMTKKSCARQRNNLSYGGHRAQASRDTHGYRRAKARTGKEASGRAVAYQSGHRIGRLQQLTREQGHPAHTRTGRGSAIEHATHGHEWSPQPRPSPHPSLAHPYSATALAAGVVLQSPCADCPFLPWAVELLRSKATYTDNEGSTVSSKGSTVSRLPHERLRCFHARSLGLRVG